MVGCSASGDVITTAVDEVVERGQRAPQQRWAEQPAWQELLALHQLVSRPPTLLGFNRTLAGTPRGAGCECVRL